MKLNGKKTYIVALISVIAAVFLYTTGQIDIGLLTSITSTAFVGSGLRHGMAKLN